MLLHVSHEDVGCGIVDLQPFASQTMESWDDLLGGVGDVAPCGTEAEVDAAGNVELL